MAVHATLAVPVLGDREHATVTLSFFYVFIACYC